MPPSFFALPLALAEPAMLGVFVLLTLTCTFNLAYVLHTLADDRFPLDSRDTIAMVASLINFLAFGGSGSGYVLVRRSQR